MTERKEEEGEPDGGTFHEEPGQGCGYGGAPPWTVVLTVRSLEESEGDESRRAHEV